MWPHRTAICLDCRTALPTGHACHRVASLDHAAGRDALVTEVWGPEPLRRNLKAAARAGVVGGSSASLFDGCSGCDLGDVGDGHAVLVLLVAFVAIFVLWIAGKYLVAAVRARRHRLQARGACRGGPKLARTGVCGTIRANRVAPDPITSKSCVAFAAELRCGRGVMLRDGATLGFEIVLDSGQRVSIPAGPCAIDVSTGVRTRVPAAYLAQLDPLRRRTDDFDPFPSDGARVIVLEPGGRVEIRGPLVEQVDPKAESGFRETRTILVPDGLPRLRAI